MHSNHRASALLLAASLAVGCTQAKSAGGSHEESAAAAATLKADMRKLWEDHITWTRVFIISAVAGLPDQQAATTRLLQNQTDLGNAIKPFYGDSAGNQLTALLRGHIQTAGELVTAAKAKDKAKVDAASARWVANADSIAAFLSAANPNNWPQDALKAEMHQHLDLTLKEAQARLAGDWEADVRAYDDVHTQILKMADMLSEGIIHQFPDRVASGR